MGLVLFVYNDTENATSDVAMLFNSRKYSSVKFAELNVETKLKEMVLRYDSKIFYFKVSSLEDIQKFKNAIEFRQFERVIVWNSNCICVDQIQFKFLMDKLLAVKNPLRLMSNNQPVGIIAENYFGLNHFLDSRGFIQERADQTNWVSIEKDYSLLDLSNYQSLIQLLQSKFTLRFFNQMQETGDIITKSSKHKQKIRKEYMYGELIPASLKRFFIIPFGFEESSEFSKYEMEKINFPDASLYWLYGAFSANEFEIFLKKIDYFLEARLIYSRQSISTSADNLYVEKVRTRIDEFAKTETYKKISRILISQGENWTLESLFSKYLNIYKSQKASNFECLSHGDLCLSNILYDKRTKMMKFIDPKGAETSEDLYMPATYDVIKLSHSILGDYDYINNGLFEISYTENLNLKLKIHEEDSNLVLKKKFLHFLESKGFDIVMIRTLEASLFLSMLPFHIDDEKRVLGFVMNAKKILDWVEGEKNGR